MSAWFSQHISQLEATRTLLNNIYQLQLSNNCTAESLQFSDRAQATYPQQNPVYPPHRYHYIPAQNAYFILMRVSGNAAEREGNPENDNSAETWFLYLNQHFTHRLKCNMPSHVR